MDKGMLKIAENKRGVGEGKVGGKLEGRRRREEPRKGFYGVRQLFTVY